jgi:hypothetical protein
MSEARAGGARGTPLCDVGTRAPDAPYGSDTNGGGLRSRRCPRLEMNRTPASRALCQVTISAVVGLPWGTCT